MSSTDERLRKIFPQAFQITRITKQLNDAKELRQKNNGLEIKFLTIKNEYVVFRTQLLQQAYKGTKIPEPLTKQNFQFKLVIGSEYPAKPPKLFFMSQAMTKYGLKPFRNYFQQFIRQPWSTRITLVQSIKSMPLFLENCLFDKSQSPKDIPVSLQQYFDVESILSWKFGQMHPVKLYKHTISKDGLIFIDSLASEVTFLESTQIESNFKTCDFMKGQEIHNIYKKRNSKNKYLLEAKLSYPHLSGKYVIQFSSVESENLILALMDCSRIAKIEKNENNTKQNSSSSSQYEDDFLNEIPQQGMDSRKNSINDELNLTIEEIKDQIIVCESLIDNSMTSENISQYVSLLQKAIQYYSAQGGEHYQVYLSKIQSIFKNEMAQILLESANDEKKKQSEEKARKNENKEFESIFDLIQ